MANRLKINLACEPNSRYNRLMIYNWQQADWPEFKYDLESFEDALFSFAERMGRVSGLLKGLPENTQTEAMIDMMVSEAIKTSEIEGEYISRQDVISSIRKNLGLNQNIARVKDKKAEGAAELMVDVRDTSAEVLTQGKLFSWHKMIMKGSRGVKIGSWRTHKDAMQVTSGQVGKQKVHYEAPPSKCIPEEMKKFIRWFNETGPGGSKEVKNWSGSICSYRSRIRKYDCYVDSICSSQSDFRRKTQKGRPGHAFWNCSRSFNWRGCP